MDNEAPPLGDNQVVNKGGAAVRAAVGMIPIVGAPFTELVNQFIPNVRVQRIEAYLQWLTEKTKTVLEEQLRQRLMNEPAMDLVEEGAFQAVRALTNERREQIATAVANGLTGEEIDLVEAKRMLSILRQLDDAQVIILASKLTKNQNREFHQKHQAVLKEVSPHMGSPREDLDRATVQQLAKQQLVSLGLIRLRFKKPQKGQSPEMDPKTGMVASSGSEITPLGRLLLRAIGLATEGDF